MAGHQRTLGGGGVEAPVGDLARSMRGIAWVCKRAVDYVVAGVALLALAPVVLVVAVCIRLDSPGPVFFRQERVGRGGRVFRMWKFRSMVVRAEACLPGLMGLNEASGPFFKMRDDPRVTRVGQILRRSCLDEVPQLLNVLAGHMSLVGPRPFLPDEQRRAPELFRWRLATMPGITGLWQVGGGWWLAPEEGVRLDREYVERWSLGLDAAIVLKTVGRVISLWRHPGAGLPAGSGAGRRLRLRPEVSVVVVTHDSAADIERCIRSIETASTNLSVEVIVVDNASVDGTAQTVRELFPEVCLVRSARRQGFATNANLGAGRASGRMLLLLNPDARLHAGALDVLVEFLDDHPEVGLCAPRLVYPDGSHQLSARRFPTPGVALVRRTPLRWVLGEGFAGERRHLMASERLDRLRKPCSVDWVLGAAIVLKRSTWETLGGLDEGYRLYCEDIDLCWRAWEAGYAVAYVPGAIVEHDLGALTSKRFATRATVWHFRSMARFVRLHGLGRPALAPDVPRVFDAGMAGLNAAGSAMSSGMVQIAYAPAGEATEAAG